MGLAKEGYKTAINGTTIIKVPIDSSGNLISNSEGGTATSTKTFNFTRSNASNSRADNQAVIQAIFGFTDTVYTINDDKFRVTWE